MATVVTFSLPRLVQILGRNHSRRQNDVAFTEELSKVGSGVMMAALSAEAISSKLGRTAFQAGIRVGSLTGSAYEQQLCQVVKETIMLTGFPDVNVLQLEQQLTAGPSMFKKIFSKLGGSKQRNAAKHLFDKMIQDIALRFLSKKLTLDDVGAELAEACVKHLRDTWNGNNVIQKQMIESATQHKLFARQGEQEISPSQNEFSNIYFTFLNDWLTVQDPRNSGTTTITRS